MMFLFSGSHSGSKKKTRGEMEFKDIKARVADRLMVRTDSRAVKPGECFVAMPGTSVRGVDFIPAALDNGAEYFVVMEEDRARAEAVIGERAGVAYVENTAQALGELARAYFKTGETEMKIVGLTGTNGKTTTSYIIEHLLASAGLKVGVLGTVTYRWPGFSVDASLTTPDCWMIHELLANMDKSDVDVAVMEVSSHALDQYRVAGLDFDVAAISNLTQDHLDYHGDMETYFQAKKKLFTDYPRQGKSCVANFNDAYCRRLLECCVEPLAYGLGKCPVPDVPAIEGAIRKSSGKGLLIECAYQGKTWEVRSPLIGEHNAMNLLTTMAVGFSLGLNCKDMDRLENFDGVPGRLERVRNERGLDIFVDYAHTPDALINVQRTLKGLDFNRLITVFGCGGDRDRTKRPLMAEAVAKFADVAVLTSDNPRTEDPEQILDDAMPGLAGFQPMIREIDRQTAISRAVAMMDHGDVLLIAGKGHEEYQILGTEKIHFSDREAVLKALGEGE